MKLIKSKIIPFRGFKAINLFGYVFHRKELNSVDLNHEKIHSIQQRELWYIGFFLIYGFHYVWNLFKYWNFYKAYENVCFEREAYEFESVDDYLNFRHKQSWIWYW